MTAALPLAQLNLAGFAPQLTLQVVPNAETQLLRVHWKYVMITTQIALMAAILLARLRKAFTVKGYLQTVNQDAETISLLPMRNVMLTLMAAQTA